MNDSGHRIRGADKGDAAAIHDCVRAAYQHYVQRMGKAPGPMLEDYSAVIAQHHAFVAEQGRHLIGVLVLIELERGPLLDNVAVHPNHQGHGLGRQLVEFAESRAKAMGYDEIHLYTHEAMVENIAMYEHLGYEETERRREKGYDRVYMRKALL